MTSAHLLQDLAGRTSLLYVDILLGKWRPSWHDVATCARLAHLLALDRMPRSCALAADEGWAPLGPPLDEDDRIRRQYLWRSIVDVDCMLSITMGVPQIILSEDATTPLPYPVPAASPADEAGLSENHPRYFATHPQSDPPLASRQLLYWKTLKLLADAAALARRAPPPYGGNPGFVKPRLQSIRCAHLVHSG